MSDQKIEHIPRMTEEELVSFVRDFMQCRIGVSAYCSPDEVRISFPSLDHLYELLTPTAMSEVGVLYEEYEKAVCWKQEIPVFNTLRIMHVDDWARVHATIVHETFRLENLTLVT